MWEQEVQFLVILIIAVFAIIILAIVGLIIAFQQRRARFMIRQERTRASYEEQLLKVQIEISEQNFKSISTELHDNIGQILTVANIEAKKLSNKGSATPENLKELSGVISQGLSELRNLSKSLNTDYLKSISFREALQREIDHLSRIKLIKGHLDYDASVDLSSDQALILFRMCQEFISNTVKYSAADNIGFSVKEKAGYIEVNAWDDGHGYDVNEINEGVGFNSLKQRARVINAELQLESTLGNGCSMFIRLKK